MHEREKQKGNANRATLAVAKEGRILLALDRRGKDYGLRPHQTSEETKRLLFAPRDHDYVYDLASKGPALKDVSPSQSAYRVMRKRKQILVTR